MNSLVAELMRGHKLEYDELLLLLEDESEKTFNELICAAAEMRDKIYGKRVFYRGLIEFTNYCKNNCYYCGIRNGNSAAVRYRLSKAQILQCCRGGYALGFRTFVLQGGEDPYFSVDDICDIVAEIKKEFPDCAVTLSIGEYDEQSYRRFFEAGAQRYLLRHETANPQHYKRLHPPALTAEHRKHCLHLLKEIGFQVGAGFMVGSPFQTKANLAEDLLFLKELEPHMVGIGPFIPHCETPFKEYPAGTLNETLKMLAIVRLLLPEALLPATTALGTIAPNGRELGLKAGANVVMPNLSPADFRKAYSLYDNKLCTGNEAAEGLEALRSSLAEYGFVLSSERGDHPHFRMEH